MIDHLTTTTRDGLPVELSPFVPTDVDRVYELCQDADIQHWTTVPSPYLMSNAETYVNDYTAEAWREIAASTFSVSEAGPELVWAVRLSGALAGLWGTIGLKRYGQGELEIGWWLGAGARGRGVMRAVVAETLRTAFGPLEAREVWWYAMTGNRPSALIAQRTGFEYRGLICEYRGRTLPAEEALWSAVIRQGEPLVLRAEWPLEFSTPNPGS